MRLPNFLVIGAHKAGTTSLYYYLKSHPQIFMPEKLKETRFFAFNPENPDHVKKPPKEYPITSINEYSSLFDAVKDEKAYGEASPVYLTSEYAARNIFKHIPDAKLIVSLRNPIDRDYSLFLMDYRRGLVSEKELYEYNFNSRSADRSQYYPKLQTYYDIFDRKQIKVILFDELITETEKTVKDIYRFLGVSDSFTPEIAIHNRGGIPKSKYFHDIANNTKLQRLLKAYLPETITRILKNAKDKNLKKPPQLTNEQRIEAIKLVKEDLLKLETLIQRDLSSWYKV